MHSTISLLESLPFGKKIHIYGCEHPASIAVYINSYGNKGPHVIQAPENFFDDIEQSFSFFNPDLQIHKLPALDPFFPSRETIKTRLQWFYRALTACSSDVFLCSKKSLHQKTLPKEIFQQKIHHLTKDSPLPTASLLQNLGYSPSIQVEEEGCFSQRGGIFDIFSPAHKYPIRIEALGDRVHSLRYFDSQTNRSLQPVSSMTLIPCHEVPFSAEFRLKVTRKLKKYFQSSAQSSSNLLNIYLKKLSKGLFFPETALFLPLFYDQPGQALDFFPFDFQLWTFQEDLQLNSDSSNEIKLDHLKNSHFNLQLIEQLFFKDLPSHSSQIHLHPIIHEDKNLWPFRTLKKISNKKSFAQFKPNPIFICTPSENQIKQIQFQLQKEDFETSIISSKERNWSQWREEQFQNPKKIHLISALIPYHFESPDSLFIKGDQWLGKIHTPSAPSFSSYFSKTNAFRFSEIKINDPVVDKIHGVGLYRGLKELNLNKIKGEYIELKYKNEDRLYIPVHHIHRLFQFKSQLGIKAVDQLGQPYWNQKLAKAKTSIQQIVMDLLKMYSSRSKIKRTPFKFPSHDLEQFEKQFPFEETRGQSRAIKDVLKDMSENHPMDRIIVGDSGFGKTEVSMRAVFKAIEDGRQAAFLAPTTILSLQHFESFKTRFASWPIRIELINRLVPSSKIKNILKDLAQQKVDILIGSHRLLSSDIQFKNLGLIIIDEEHRFGVRQKEKLKKLRLNVDCIYMSATPIPRTLNMSLSGAKDISVIDTAPKNRISPKVSIIHFQEDKIKVAILREVQRGGQVIFIHNKVQSLQRMYDRLTKLLPEISIQIAHGQMEEKELEKNILDFFSKRCDLLLCTTIVETGMDFEKANTIIINDAQNFGLSQLYQLRGRVGRRAHAQSYCYFVIPEDLTLTSLAVERLNFLQTHNYLNSGYQVARYDLEIRGGGEFLGSKQSGHIQNIGYDLYLEMLKDSLAPSKADDFEPEVKLPWPAYIPPSYIQHDKLRLMYYKYLSDMEDMAKIQDFEDELRDSFGPLPDEVNNLVGQIMIQHLCKKLKIKELKILGNTLHLLPSNTADKKTKITLPEKAGWIQVYDILQNISDNF